MEAVSITDKRGREVYDSIGIKNAVLLVGGKGTRLKPLTDKIPKGLLKVQNKSIIEHLFDLLKRYDVTETFLSAGHLKEEIKNYFKGGEDFGMKVLYIEEEEPLGTAGPLRLVKDNFNSSFIVSNGDELKDIDINEMFRLHKKTGALATIALTRVDNPSNYGVARLDGSRIIEFVEKPASPPSNLINAGFYIIEPEVIGMIPDGFAMLEKDVFPKLAREGKLLGFPFSGQWFDIGTIERYKVAEQNWLRKV